MVSRADLPGVIDEIPGRYHGMPYRVLLWLISARLDATAADEVGRARQDLHRRDAARERGGKTRIVRPDGVFGPDVGRDRGRRLVAVRM